MALNFGGLFKGFFKPLFEKVTIHYLAISQMAWTASDPDTDNVTIDGFGAKANADNINFGAPVNLPHEAIVISCIVYGNAAASAESWLLRRSNLNSATVGTIASGSINSSDKPSSLHATIDNTNYSYNLGTGSLDTNDRIYGAVITYSTRERT